MLINNSNLTNLDYIEMLPITDEQKSNLRNKICQQSNITPSNIHQILHDGTQLKTEHLTDDVALGSVTNRLRMAWPKIAYHPKFLVKDSLGRTKINAMPNINRTTMFPKPWFNDSAFCFRELFRNESYKKIKGQKTFKINYNNNWNIVGTIRRYILLILTLFPTVIATCYMKNILPFSYKDWIFNEIMHESYTDIIQSIQQLFLYILQGGIIILFAILFFWISANFWTAWMGFWQLLIGYDKYSIADSITGNEPLNKAHRTALIMPICNENVERVFAGLRATYESVFATNQLDHFDFYILSDSYNTDICVAEQKAWIELCEETNGTGKIFYRRRRRRVKCKSGNIDDFCRRWGKQYTYMVILDADSVMSGYCITNLVRLMEANPSAGIIQCALKASGMNTLYARCQQFANRVYGPLFTTGLHFWQLGEFHYWGHNAIIRVEPFIKHCALAPLPGKGTFARSILSHDFVEAALMRRAGWGVWLAYDLPGSYEESPPNLIDELKRDRRWCHGNLMNVRLLLIKGIHPVHRAVFLTGVMSYLSAPIWFIFLILLISLQIIHKLIKLNYFLQSSQLYSMWTAWNLKITVVLFSIMMLLLFLPKILGVILIIIKGSHEFGGTMLIILSMILEIMFSIILSPIKILFHTIFVISSFLGWSIKWNSPQRNSNSTTWSESFKHHSSQIFFGILIGASNIIWLDLNILYLLSPIIISLIFSPLISVFSSRENLGLICQRVGLFLIPEESSPPKELRATEKYLKHNSKRTLTDGFSRAVIDPSYNALAVSMATARHGMSKLIDQNRREYLIAVLRLGPINLSTDQRLAVLSDPVILSRLHLYLWLNPDQFNIWCKPAIINQSK